MYMLPRLFLNFTKPKDPKDSHRSLGPQTGRAEKTVDSWIITLWINVFGDSDNSCSALMLPFWDKCTELRTVALKQTSRAKAQRAKSRTIMFRKKPNDLNIQKKTESAFKVKQIKIHSWKEISGFFFYFCSYLVKETKHQKYKKIGFYFCRSANVSTVI